MNSSKIIVLAVSVLLYVVVGGCSSKPAHLSVRPSTLLIKASKEFPAGQQATVVATLRNEGGSPLTVIGVKSSCGCTVATTETFDVIAPGQEAPLKFNVAVPLFGRRESVVMIDTNSPDTPTVRLVIQIEGDDEPVPRIVMQTQNLALRGTTAGQTIHGELEIQSAELLGSEPWIQRLQPSVPMVEVTRRDPVAEEQVAEGIVYRRYVFDVNAISPTAGRQFVNVTPEFTSPGKQMATFVSRVSLETVNHVSVVPSELVISCDEMKKGFSRRIIVLSKDDQPFVIQSVTWSTDQRGSQSLIDHLEDAERIVHRLELKFPAQPSEVSVADVFVEIKTSHSTVPDIRLHARVKSDE